MQRVFTDNNNMCILCDILGHPRSSGRTFGNKKKEVYKKNKNTLFEIIKHLYFDILIS